ncbi:MAG: hypothetical protein HC945_01070 [Nitrosarchaeum sp.]|nr:hypothetical protein [Nitrosarchaeum sp.]
MVLTEKKEAQLSKMPLIEANISKSKDGKYLIHKTVITTIRPMAYYKAIAENVQTVEEEDVEVTA